MRRARSLGRAAALLLAALGAGLALAPTAGLGATSHRTGTDHPDDKRERHVLYEETDYKGEVSYHVIAASDFDTKVAAAAKTNAVLDKAYAQAQKAWKEDPEHQDVRFPMAPPRPLRCRRLMTYSTREKAEAAQSRRQDRVDRQFERTRKREEDRLARLSDAAREKEAKQAEFLKAAEKLFEEKLLELRGADDAKPLVHPPVEKTKPD